MSITRAVSGAGTVAGGDIALVSQGLLLNDDRRGGGTDVTLVGDLENRDDIAAPLPRERDFDDVALHALHLPEERLRCRSAEARFLLARLRRPIEPEDVRSLRARRRYPGMPGDVVGGRILRRGRPHVEDTLDADEAARIGRTRSGEPDSDGRRALCIPVVDRHPRSLTRPVNRPVEREGRQTCAAGTVDGDRDRTHDGRTVTDESHADLEVAADRSHIESRDGVPAPHRDRLRVIDPQAVERDQRVPGRACELGVDRDLFARLIARTIQRDRDVARTACGATVTSAASSAVLPSAFSDAMTRFAPRSGFWKTTCPCPFASSVTLCCASPFP